MRNAAIEYTLGLVKELKREIGFQNRSIHSHSSMLGHFKELKGDDRTITVAACLIDSQEILNDGDRAKGDMKDEDFIWALIEQLGGMGSSVVSDEFYMPAFNKDDVFTLTQLYVAVGASKWS